MKRCKTKKPEELCHQYFSVWLEESRVSQVISGAKCYVTIYIWDDRVDVVSDTMIVIA